MRSRLAAWLVTGPVGHGYAGCADAAALLLALAHARLRGLVRGRRAGRAGSARPGARSRL